MSDEHLNTIVGSPYDDVPRQGRWWPLVAGLLIGAASVLVLLILTTADSASNDGDASTPTTQAPSPSSTITTEPAATQADSPFPAGYVAISDTEAVKPHHIYRHGEQVFVSMTTSYARGLSAETEPLFLGGLWTLEASDGVTIESTGTIFDDNPGSSDQILGSLTAAFTVPPNKAVRLDRLHLTERWDPVIHTETIRLPVNEWPYTLPEPTTVPFDGFTFTLDTLYFECCAFAEATWTLEEVSSRHNMVLIDTTIIGADGAPIATAESPSRPPRTSGYSTPATIALNVAPGRVVLNTIEDIDAFYVHELGQATELAITITVITTNPTTVDDTTIDLTNLPITDT